MSSKESKASWRHHSCKGGEDAQSTSSQSSTSSRSSTASLAVTKARARAEAAKARAAHAKREIEIKVEQARLQATLEALQEEKDAAIAEAEILAAAFIEIDHISASKSSKEISLQRTTDYVRRQANVVATAPSSSQQGTCFPSLMPQASRASSNGSQSSSESVSDTYNLAKYLARSQLVTSGLSFFYDKPMSY